VFKTNGKTPPQNIFSLLLTGEIEKKNKKYNLPTEIVSCRVVILIWKYGVTIARAAKESTL